MSVSLALSWCAVATYRSSYRCVRPRPSLATSPATNRPASSKDLGGQAGQGWTADRTCPPPAFPRNLRCLLVALYSPLHWNRQIEGVGCSREDRVQPSS